jgi:hypothetical protein
MSHSRKLPLPNAGWFTSDGRHAWMGGALMRGTRQCLRPFPRVTGVRAEGVEIGFLPADTPQHRGLDSPADLEKRDHNCAAFPLSLRVGDCAA